MIEVQERSWSDERVGELLERAYAHAQSGVLSIECTQGSYAERGEVYLFAGKPVYARTKRFRGEEALGYLLTWRNIHAFFVSEVPESPALLPLSVKTAALAGSLSALPTLLPPLPAPIEVGQTEQSSGTERLIPRRTKLERHTLSWPVTYPQRWIYFLIDDRRTIGDLSQCTGMTVMKIKWLLHELQDQGLVQNHVTFTEEMSYSS